MAAYIALVIEQENDARRSLRQQRVFRTRRTLDAIADHHLERYYRLPRSAVQRLCDALAPALRRPTARSHSLPVDAQVLLALRFYASGSFQSVVGDVANMSQTSASRIINTVSGALCELAKSGIKFPATSRAALRTARGFLEINGFPKVLGCIDGTHIALKIAKQDQHIYRNRKGYDSLNVQAICNASNEITQLTVKWPGSTHDSFMWRNCDLADKFEAGDMPEGWLLGDAGYPLQPWLMTPFRKPQKKEEENYNDCLTKTRQVIERTFGIMKSRFRCLDRSGGVLQYSPSVCCRLIVACAVLHNYCTRHHISLAEPPVEESDDEEEEEEDRPSTAQDTPSGTAVRNELVNTVFNMLEESEGGVPEVDAEVLASLQARGATFVFLDVPAGTEFGMNMSTHTVGDNFRGVKLIPAGVHFIHYSAVGRSGNSAPRTGFFHDFAQGELLVKRWDKAAEDISSAPISAEEEERIRANLTGDLDRYLGVFSYSEWSRWISLSKHITREVVARLQPESKLICSATPFESQPFCSHRGRRNSEGHADGAAMDTEDKEADIAAKADKLLELKELPEFMIRYTPFPKRRHPSNATPAEITRHGMDSSYVLESLLSAWPHERDLLGELQFVFVCFLVGHVYPSFEQWQRLVSAFCTSAEAVNRHPDLYSELLSVLHFQLREVPTDFFVDIVARKNFVTDALSALFRNVADSDVPDVGPASLKKKAFRFKTSLVELMGWSFDEEEPDEERPVVVELDDVD